MQSWKANHSVFASVLVAVIVGLIGVQCTPVPSAPAEKVVETVIVKEAVKVLRIASSRGRPRERAP